MGNIKNWSMLPHSTVLTELFDFFSASLESMTRAKLTIFLCWHSFYWCITGGNDTDDAYIVDVFDSGEAWIASINDTDEVSNLFDLFLNSIDTVHKPIYFTPNLFYTELFTPNLFYSKLIVYQTYFIPNLCCTNLVYTELVCTNLYYAKLILYLTFFFELNLFYIEPNLFHTGLILY